MYLDVGGCILDGGLQSRVFIVVTQHCKPQNLLKHIFTNYHNNKIMQTCFCSQFFSLFYD